MEVPYTIIDLNDGVRQVKWAGIASGDTCTPFAAASTYPGKSVQVTGTFGVAGTAAIQGSNWGPLESTPTYKTLTDPQMNALQFLSAGLEEIIENTALIKPTISGGDGTTSLTVRLVLVSR